MARLTSWLYGENGRSDVDPGKAIIGASVILGTSIVILGASIMIGAFLLSRPQRFEMINGKLLDTVNGSTYDNKGSWLGEKPFYWLTPGPQWPNAQVEARQH